MYIDIWIRKGLYVFIAETQKAWVCHCETAWASQGAWDDMAHGH